MEKKLMIPDPMPPYINLDTSTPFIPIRVGYLNLVRNESI